MHLWGKEQEEEFFRQYLSSKEREKLFYVSKEGRFYAYWPKSYKGKKTTLQSRNGWIGTYCEQWCTDLFNEIANIMGGYAVKKVLCEEIGLVKKKEADVAICKNKSAIQKPKDILMIIEVKMSLVWNWELITKGTNAFEIVCIDDYRRHQGEPSLSRSDSMLKAIGKSTVVRVSSHSAAKIPIVIICNSPISKSYYNTVDHLKKSGIIQGFWSVNPKPAENDVANIKKTPYNGFYRFDTYEELKEMTLQLQKEDKEFFYGMQSKKRLSEIIDLVSKEPTYETKAQKFLEFLRQAED